MNIFEVMNTLAGRATMTDQSIIQTINQLAEIRQKIKTENLEKKFERNFNRLFSVLEEEGFICRYPLGERCDATRTDCEASIAGKVSKNMIVTQVIKPAVYKKDVDGITLIQKAVVIIEKK